MLDNKNLYRIPLLIIGNKIDLPEHMHEGEIIEGVINRIESGLFIE